MTLTTRAGGGAGGAMGSNADVDRLNLINDAAALRAAGYAPGSQALAYAAARPWLPIRSSGDER